MWRERRLGRARGARAVQAGACGESDGWGGHVGREPSRRAHVARATAGAGTWGESAPGGRMWRERRLGRARGVRAGRAGACGESDGWGGHVGREPHHHDPSPPCRMRSAAWNLQLLSPAVPPSAAQTPFSCLRKTCEFRCETVERGRDGVSYGCVEARPVPPRSTANRRQTARRPGSRCVP